MTSRVSFMEAKALRRESFAFGSLLFLLEALVFVLFVAFDAGYVGQLEANRYGYFRDVNIMIFFGFGFLMTFLRRYGYSAIVYTLIISALVVQLSLFLEYAFCTEKLDPSGNLVLTIENLMNGLFCAGAVMISFGAVLGTVTPLQLVIMATLEAVIYWVNCFVTTIKIGAHGTGGGMVIHLFGAYFGLAVAANLKAIPSHKDNSASYTSDITSLAGTLFLWLLWPSFNAAVAKTEKDQQMAATNTFLSLCACTVATAIATRLLSDHKFDAVHMQNATLAGGVAMGVACDLPTLGLKGAILGGFVAGLLSCFGFAKVSLLLGKWGIQDTCGVHNLHGMPGLLSALIGIIAMARRSSKDATTQGFAMFSTLAIALAGGLITGAVMKFVSRALGTTQLQGDHFNDKTFWITTSDYGSVIDDRVDEEASSEEVVQYHVFIYGTMKLGFHNHQVLSALLTKHEGQLVGAATTSDLFLFTDMYGCPYAGFQTSLSAASAGIKGELYAFNPLAMGTVLAELDEFEGVGQGRYERRTFAVRSEESRQLIRAYVYGIDASRVPGLMQGTAAYKSMPEYSLEFHSSHYTPRDERNSEFKQSWGGYTKLLM